MHDNLYDMPGHCAFGKHREVDDLGVNGIVGILAFCCSGVSCVVAATMAGSVIAVSGAAWR